MSGMTTALAGLTVIMTAATLAWVLSVKRRDASIADVCWGSGFVLLAWLYCLAAPTLAVRSGLVAALTTLRARAFRITSGRRNNGKREDPRYQAMRASSSDPSPRRRLALGFSRRLVDLALGLKPILQRFPLVPTTSLVDFVRAPSNPSHS